MRAGWIVVALVFASASASAGCDTLFGVEPRVDAAAGADAAAGRDGAAGVDAVWPDGPPGDVDGDGVVNEDDNCPSVANMDQNDEDGTGVGDRCDPCPHLAIDGADADVDGVGDGCDFDPDERDHWAFFAGFRSLILPACTSAAENEGWTCWHEAAHPANLTVEAGDVVFPLANTLDLQLRAGFPATSRVRVAAQVTVESEDVGLKAHVRLIAHLSTNNLATVNGYLNCSIERTAGGAVTLYGRLTQNNVVQDMASASAPSPMVGEHVLMLDLAPGAATCRLDGTTVTVALDRSAPITNVAGPAVVGTRAVQARARYLGVVVR